MAVKWRRGDITPMRELTPGPIVSHVEADGTQHVFAVHSGRVHEYWWKGAMPATHEFLTPQDGVAHPRGPLASHVFEREGTQHVFYQGSDNHLYEIWWAGSSAPEIGDLTLTSGGPSARADLGRLRLGSLASHVFSAEGTQHVFYASDDGDIHELFWRTTDRATHTNLTRRSTTPAPPATGELTSHVVGDQSQHVFYRSGGDIIELRWSRGQEPIARSLTGLAAGAPPAASPPSSHVEAHEGTQHVFYVSAADSHVSELWWTGEEGMPTREDVTFQSGSPPVDVIDDDISHKAFGRLATHWLPLEDTQHVFFSDAEACREIWWVGPGVKHPASLKSGDTNFDFPNYRCSHVATDNSQHVFFWGTDENDRFTLQERWTQM